MSSDNNSSTETTQQLFGVLDMMTKELENAHMGRFRGGGNTLNNVDTTKVVFSNVLWEMSKSIKDQNGDEVILPRPMSQRLNLILTLLRIQLRLEKGLN